jgi:hypothetical protein
VIGLLEQRINIKFYVKLGKNANDSYGGEAVKKSCDFEWHKWFKEGRKNVEDDARSRPKSKITGENVKSAESGTFR